MPDLPSRSDLYQLGRGYLVQRAKKIDPSQVDVEGSDANLFVGIGSVLADAVLKQLLYSTGRLLIDGAQDDDLDRLAWDRYSLTRKGASNALGAVRLSRLNSALGAGSVPIGTKVGTGTNVEYVTTTAGNFGASTLNNVFVNVRAVQAGHASQVGANAITKFSQPGLLWDKTLQVNNDLPTAGGEDAEDDDTFKARIRDFWKTARRGILAAIEFGATSVPGVVSAQAFEVVTTNGMPARVVELYIADGSGIASAQLAAVVSTALLDYRAAGITVVINTSLPTLVSIQLSLTFQAGVDTVTLGQNVQAAVVAFVNSLPVNGPMYVADLLTVLKRFAPDGLVVDQNTIVAPVGDLLPAVGMTLRTDFPYVTVNLR